MRIKPKNPRKKALDTSALADEFGLRYEALIEAEKTTKKNVADLKDQIKKSASELGEEEGDTKLLKGSLFEVGYKLIGAANDVDWVAFAKRYPEKYKSYLSLKLDEEKVAAALESGRLPREVLKKFLVPKGSPSNRIVVKRRGTDYEK